MYNTSVHLSTGFTPAHLFFGRQLNVLLDMVNGSLESTNSPVSTFDEFKKTISDLYELARKNMDTRQKVAATNYDKKLLDDVLKSKQLSIRLFASKSTSKTGVKMDGCRQDSTRTSPILSGGNSDQKQKHSKMDREEDTEKSTTQCKRCTKFSTRRKKQNPTLLRTEKLIGSKPISHPILTGSKPISHPILNPIQRTRKCKGDMRTTYEIVQSGVETILYEMFADLINMSSDYTHNMSVKLRDILTVILCYDYWGEELLWVT